MGIYGEHDNRFRERPSALALVSMSFFSTIACAMISSGVVSLLRVLTTRETRSEFPFLLYFPFASDPFLGLYPLRVDQSVRAAGIAIAIPAIVALVLLFFFPTTQKLAGRLSLHTFVCSLITFGTLAPMVDRKLFDDFRLYTRLDLNPALGIVVAGVVVMAVLLVLVERRAVRVLGNVADVGSPGKRLYLWLLRIPLPFAVLAALCKLNGWTDGAIASLVVIAATFFEAISHVPRYQFERLGNVRMREAAATWPIVTAVLLCGSVWLFGLDLLHFPRRAVRIDDGKPSIVRLDALQESQKKQFEPKIEMNWSKERK
ncbi:MAG: hypothetical protein NDJ92_03255 [Thermoanaerobaculia bacterium]|nr:hypothetical protein [Thermoanaerobaculia bacterium]